ncbi:MAG: aromatic-ring-hydroxylating dioxygenase subunit beta [Gammaproteobacteria bacterium]
MDRSQAEDFLYREARLLNTGKNREWQKLFTRDAIYWVPANDPDSDPEEHVSYIYDDMDLLDERLGRLESDSCWAQQPPSTTLHQISNVEVEPDTENEVTLRSNVLIYEYRNNVQRRFYPMQCFPAFCEHRLRKEGDQWKIAYKKVALLNCDGEIHDLTFLI